MQQALEHQSVLVEIVRFGVFNFHHGTEASWWQPAHYAAWVFPPEGMGEVRLVDLGPAEEIEHAVSDYRKAMRGSGEEINRKGEGEAEAELRKLLLAPGSARCGRSARAGEVLELADQPRRLALAGAVGRCCRSGGRVCTPWKTATINYLISGCDLKLLPRVSSRRAAQAARGVADPDFDLVAPSHDKRPSLPAGAGEADRSVRAADRGAGGQDFGDSDLHELAAAARNV